MHIFWSKDNKHRFAEPENEKDYIYEQLLSIQMQAVGMLDSQRRKMLQLEGLFYKA